MAIVRSKGWRESMTWQLQLRVTAERPVGDATPAWLLRGWFSGAGAAELKG
jgi:hypothetical protein